MGSLMLTLANLDLDMADGHATLQVFASFVYVTSGGRGDSRQDCADLGDRSLSEPLGRLPRLSLSPVLWFWRSSVSHRTRCAALSSSEPTLALSIS